MSQKDEAEGGEGTETGTEGADDNAEFSGAWDDIATEESGQPSPADGRRDDEGGETDQEGDKAEQIVADEASDPSDADATASRDETSDDIWASAPAALREAYEAERAGRVTAEKLVRSNGARAAQATHELNALKAQVASKRDETGATEEGAEATDPKARFEQLREEYPDLAVPIIDQMMKLEAQVAKLSEGQASKDEAASEDFYAEQHTQLLELHDDVPTIVQSQEYADWLGQQIPAIQNIVEQNRQRVVNAAECAFVFDLFKRDTGYGDTDPAESLAAKRERQLQAGTGVGKGAPTVTRDDKGGTYEDEWDRMAANERRAATGRR